MKGTIALVLGLLLVAPFLVSAQADEKDVSVPLSSLVLFTSGVGYFQHDGVVEGNARMELTFSAAQVNDILKSLVLRDLDGGTISSVTYSSRDPITRTLKGFSIDLTGTPTLSGILMQARGESIGLTMTGGRSVTGVIIAVESRQVAVQPDHETVADFLDLNTADGVTSIDLRDVQGIRFLRKEVQDDLAEALRVLSTGHGVEKKKVVLHFAGNGKRRVRIGYIVESPVWKTSYRLVLADAGQHLLQGWALVENVSDVDWKAVGLTLVSGRPITFTMDLYQPLYVQRPEVQLELYQSLVPQTSQLALGDLQKSKEEAGAAADEMMAERPAPAPASKSAGRAFAPSAAATLPFAVDQGVKAAASGSAVGELFQYAISGAVTLPRQQSAMLPILSQQVAGDRFSLYNESTEPRHPLNAVRLKNTSSLHLMQGPITVFDAGMYAGDAQVSDLAPGAEQLLTYAIDLDTEVAPSTVPAISSLVSVKISRGVFWYTSKVQRERDYTVTNRGTKARTVLVEYPLDTRWTLSSPKETERTRDYYRFSVPVAAGKTGSLSVVETQTVDQSVALASLAGDQVAFYVKSPVVSAPVKVALQKLVTLQQSISDTMGQRTAKEARVNAIADDQSRIRSNMDRLSQSSDLFKRYVKTLNDEEDELAKLRDDIARLRDQEAGQRRTVDAFIQSLDIQ